MRRQLVAGNWKMNGSTASTALLLDALILGLNAKDNALDVVVCPPFLYIPQAVNVLSGTRIMVGAQNLDNHGAGAYTGEIAAEMLVDQYCEFVIVGHSERRGLYWESDELVAEKAKAAMAAGLKPIVCVGETLSEREEGATSEVVRRQLRAVLDVNGVEIFPGAVIAYEPVWAIGTGRTAAPAQAQEVHAVIRGAIAELDVQAAERTRILYGGSVKSENATGLFSCADIDGGLIGGASLEPADFLAICETAQN